MEGSIQPTDLPSLAEALAFVDLLDASVAALLAPAVAADEDEMQQQGANRPNAVLAVQPFAEAAGALERLLVRLKAGAAKAGPQQLQQEVEQLQVELQEKDDLLLRCQSNISRWQDVCGGLKTKHEANLFQNFT